MKNVKLSSSFMLLSCPQNVPFVFSNLTFGSSSLSVGTSESYFVSFSRLKFEFKFRADFSDIGKIRVRKM